MEMFAGFVHIPKILNYDSIILTSAFVFFLIVGFHVKSLVSIVHVVCVE